MTYKLYQGDCLELMAEIEAGSVDAVITDPPYGIGYASSWTTRMNGEPRVNDASFGEDEFNPYWLPLIFPLMKEDSPLYVFTRWDITHRWKAAIEAAGFHVAQRLVWDKKHWKMGDLRYYGSQIEDVLFCRKGVPEMRYPKRCGNLFSFTSSWLPEGQYNHPTQKPEDLLARFIKDSTQPGDVILDPFMGSGSTGAAAVKLGRRFIGIELLPEYYAIAEQRITEAAEQARQLELGI